MENKITVEFRDGFQGTSVNSNGKELKIGMDEWRPYEMLHSAVASCMYSTFLDVINKKKLNFEKIIVAVESKKKDEIPSSIEKMKIIFEAHGVDKNDEKTVDKFNKSLELAAKYCSMYNTLKGIVNMTYTMTFA